MLPFPSTYFNTYFNFATGSLWGFQSKYYYNFLGVIGAQNVMWNCLGMLGVGSFCRLCHKSSVLGNYLISCLTSSLLICYVTINTLLFLDQPPFCASPLITVLSHPSTSHDKSWFLHCLLWLMKMFIVLGTLPAPPPTNITMRSAKQQYKSYRAKKPPKVSHWFAMATV